MLIGRFAEYLRSRNLPFCIIDREGGRLRKELDWAMFADSEDLSLIKRQITHMFVPSVSKLRDKAFPWDELGHATVFTWVVHPNDVFRGYFPFSTKPMDFFGYSLVRLLRTAFRKHSRVFDSLFNRLITEQALAVMDGATNRSIKFFLPSVESEPRIIPIPSNSTVVSSHGGFVSEELSIGYLGRMDSMKWSAMKPFIRNVLSPLAAKRKVAIHVVSVGTHLRKFERACQHAGIRFVGYGSLPNERAREVMLSNTSVAVAMGTSALDIAGCGHPCVVLDPALGLFARPQKKFRFIFESNDYTLGEFRDFPGYVPGFREFEDMVDSAELHSAAARGKKYVEEAHSPEKCFRSLLLAIQNSGLLVSELMPLVGALNASFISTKSNPLRSMFLLKTLRSHD